MLTPEILAALHAVAAFCKQEGVSLHLYPPDLCFPVWGISFVDQQRPGSARGEGRSPAVESAAVFAVERLELARAEYVQESVVLNAATEPECKGAAE